MSRPDLPFNRRYFLIFHKLRFKKVFRNANLLFSHVRDYRHNINSGFEFGLKLRT